MKWTGTLYLSENGLTLRNKSNAEKFCRSLSGTEFLVTIEKKKSKRSDPQRKYYFGCLVPFLRDLLIDAGHNATLESTHEFIKSEFNSAEIMNHDTGEVKRIPQSTANLTKSAFSELLDRLNSFTIEWFHCSIPPPNSQTEFDYQK